jgi:dCMP deaminase
MNSRKRINRMSWAFKLADVAATMSEDPWVQVGAVALRPDNSVAAVSYNGAPPGVSIDWSDRDLRRQYVIHAEMNLLRYIKPQECDRVVVTLSPCVDCLKNIAAYGIKLVMYGARYDKSDFDVVEQIASTYGVELCPRTVCDATLGL